MHNPQCLAAHQVVSNELLRAGGVPSLSPPQQLALTGLLRLPQLGVVGLVLPVHATLAAQMKQQLQGEAKALVQHFRWVGVGGLGVR